MEWPSAQQILYIPAVVFSVEQHQIICKMTETKVTTALKDLRVGDMIWVKATVNKADLANPAATSATTKA